jgi:hypothetical protein
MRASQGAPRGDDSSKWSADSFRRHDAEFLGGAGEPRARRVEAFRIAEKWRKCFFRSSIFIPPSHARSRSDGGDGVKAPTRAISSTSDVNARKYFAAIR